MSRLPLILAGVLVGAVLGGAGCGSAEPQDEPFDAGVDDDAGDGGFDAGPPCGDGKVQGLEQCDDGPLNSDDRADACRLDCRNAYCGDGAIDTGEQCDEGRRNSDVAADACRTTCIPARCGDGTLDLLEQCDEGPNNSDVLPDACRVLCFEAACGDDVRDSDESCDDGDIILGDGCDELCASEEGHIFETEPNNDVASAEGPAVGGVLFHGAIPDPADVDVFAVTIGSASHLDLRVTCAREPLEGVCDGFADIVLRVVAPDGTTTLVTDGGPGLGRCAALDPVIQPEGRFVPPGTYYVEVSAPDSDCSVGRYDVSATLLNGFGPIQAGIAAEVVALFDDHICLPTDLPGGGPAINGICPANPFEAGAPTCDGAPGCQADTRFVWALPTLADETETTVRFVAGAALNLGMGAAEASDGVCVLEPPIDGACVDPACDCAAGRTVIDVDFNPFGAGESCDIVWGARDFDDVAEWALAVDPVTGHFTAELITAWALAPADLARETFNVNRAPLGIGQCLDAATQIGIVDSPVVASLHGAVLGNLIGRLAELDERFQTAEDFL